MGTKLHSALERVKLRGNGHYGDHMTFILEPASDDQLPISAKNHFYHFSHQCAYKI